MTAISSTSSSSSGTGTTTSASSSTASTSTSTSTGTSTTATGSATETLLSALGVSGNINATALADELSQAQYASQTDLLNKRSSTISTQISDSSNLMNLMSTLASSLNSTISQGQLASTPQIANSAVATVSAGTTSGSGTATLEVDALAQSQTLASPTIATGTSDVGSGSLTITLGTVSGTTFTAGSQSPITVTIAAGSSLSQVATAINQAGAGVQAYVATNSDGQQLVITGPQGAASAFTVSASENAADPGLARFAWALGSSGGATRVQAAGDAHYLLDGVQRTSATNAITDAAPGISLNLTGTNPGSPTTISFSDPTQAIASEMTALVSALNSVVGQVNTYTAAGSPLANSSGAHRLQQSLSALGLATVMPDATGTQPKTLGDLGLSIGKDGTFSLDSSVLNKALQTNPQAVAAMFTTGPNGVYATIFNLSSAVSNPTDGGSLGGQIAGMQAQQKTITTQLSTLASQQAALRTQLVSQFAALNSVVSADKSTQSFLTQQVSLWTNSSNASG